MEEIIKPKMVRLTEKQHLQALSLYLDHIFEKPHGTYEVKDIDIVFGTVDAHLETIPRPGNK